MKKIAMLLLLIATISAQQLKVPSAYSTIQAAIDVASNGDTVLVADGLYKENLKIDSKKIMLIGESRDKTIIDGQNKESVIDYFGYIDGNWKPEIPVKIKNFTIQNGKGPGGGNFGGGIQLSLSSTNYFLDNLIIQHNTAGGVGPEGGGGGVSFTPGQGTDSLSVNRTIFRHNSPGPSEYGALFAGNNDHVFVNNCLFYHNKIAFGGGNFSKTMFRIFSSTIAKNKEVAGGAIYDLEFTNSIVYHNEEPNVLDQLGSDADFNIYKSNIEKVKDGDYDMGDPMFVNPHVAKDENNTEPDFRLLDSSPGIGSGYKEWSDLGTTGFTDIDGNPRSMPNGSLADMGAYENKLGAPNAARPSPGLVFDGIDDGGILPKIYSLKSEQFSFSIWLKKATGIPSGDKTKNEVVFHIDKEGDPDLSLFFGSGKINFGLRTTSGFVMIKKNAGSFNDWKYGWAHIVGTYDGSMIRLYKDGVEIASEEQIGEVILNSNLEQNNDKPFRIGYGEVDGGMHFDGSIDEFAIWDDALSAAEIKALHNKGYAVDPTSDHKVILTSSMNSEEYKSSANLQGYWAMNLESCFGGIVADLSKNKTVGDFKITGASSTEGKCPLSTFKWVEHKRDTINITKENLTTKYKFEWTKSTETNGKQVSYLLHAKIGFTPWQEINENIVGTSFETTYQEFLENAFEPFPIVNAVTAAFRLYATNGTDTLRMDDIPKVIYIRRYDYLSTIDDQIPTAFALHENYPNPFNPTTTLRFDLPEVSDVNVVIYNMLGQKVRTFNMNSISAGSHSIKWNATNDLGDPVGAGVYLYQLQAKDFVKTRKMVLLK